MSPAGKLGRGPRIWLAKRVAEDVKPVRIARAYQYRGRVQSKAGGKAELPQVQPHFDDQRERLVEDREAGRLATARRLRLIKTGEIGDFRNRESKPISQGRRSDSGSLANPALHE